ncbi:UDP-N-acetylmuramate--L-alanine ligase [Actinidia chinensis var. chinensis]|uniref:UDP-N-acetylmuramate--L-alanine ligase n=1 Tax=Actinidia chinensis var. chinensis TaxID=1590841 RepID=A0A2R6QF24_ACTCC|nr:UDP-N-acetylmuramate--L-alanine ligase [Actinidia chinensis var. chinensis]
MTSGPRVLSPRLFCYQDWFEAVGGSVSCPLANMELNQARLLVHDDEALERFRATYGIPTNVIIEHPGPNEVARIVEDNVDHISIHIWLIYQAELRFPPQMRLVTGARTKIYFLTSPSGFWVVGSSGLGMTAFSHSRVQGRREDITSSSSSYTSLNSFDDDEEEKEEADSQLVLNRRRGRLIPVVKPENPTLSISILNSDKKHSDDLTRAMPQLVRGDEIVGLNSVEVNIIRDHDTNVALARAVMLPNDIAALSEEPSEIMRSLLVVQHIEAWDASYASATQAQDKAATTEVGFAELQAMACGLVYERVFNKGSIE